MEEAPENGKESSNSAHANGVNERKNDILHMLQTSHYNYSYI